MQQRHVVKHEAARMGGEGDEPVLFRFVFSTDVVARDGMIWAQNWDLSEFRTNPVVLYVHESSSIVVGRAHNVHVDEAGRLVGDIEFDSGLDPDTGDPKNPLARMLSQQVDGGFLRMVSASMQPGSWTLRKHLPATHKYYASDETDAGWGAVLGLDSPNVLREVSLVPIGADPNALHEARSAAPADRGLLRAMLIDMLANDPAVRKAAEPPAPSDPLADWLNA